MPILRQQLQDFPPLKALMVEKDNNPALNVVLFHGYGANAMNLFPLHRYIDAGIPLRWIFPEGPDPVNPPELGRSWFPLDIEAVHTGQRAEYAHSEDLSLIVKKAYQALKPLSLSNIPLVIGGFSQGSMLAVNLVMTTSLKVDGLIVLSGATLDRQNWLPNELEITRQGLPFFQSHGTTDAILDYAEGQRLSVALKESGLKGELFSFNGGHEIPIDVLTQLQQFFTHIH